jgi:hypothetical protein
MALFKKTYDRIAVLSILWIGCSLNALATDRQEAVYVQTDRPAYVTGESVFYKWYVLDATTRKKSDISKVGYMVLRAPKSNPALKIRVKVEDGLSSGRFVLPDSLPSGNYQLVAFTSTMKNTGAYFTQEIVVGNRFDKNPDYKQLKPQPKDSNRCFRSDTSFWIETDKQVYGPREKVVVRLGKKNASANIAVSVYEDPPVASSGKSMIETLNEWSVKPAVQPVPANNLPETRAKILRGRVFDASTGKNVQKATVFLSCPDTVANLQYALTNATGMFQMLLGDYYNGKELFFTINDMPVGENWKLEVEDNFLLSPKWDPDLTSEKNSDKDYWTKSQDIAHINRSYQLEDIIHEKAKEESAFVYPLVYHCAAKGIHPAEFVPLNDFQEIGVELLLNVKIIQHDDKYLARMVAPLSRFYADRDPAIFLDGVFVDDINKILPLGSDRISKIEVLENQRAFGDLILYGIISITSKSNEILSSVPASNSLRLKNDAIGGEKCLVTVHPDSIKNEHTPFFKQLLYWNPDITVKENSPTVLEFYTSDNTGPFILKAEGISEDGTPVSACIGIQMNEPINTTTK